MEIDILQNLLSDNGMSDIIPKRKIKEGGYKLVYEVDVNHVPEAFKLIAIPNESIPDIDKFQLEVRSRVWREIEALSKCHRPEIVKLGSVSPRIIHFNGIEYIIYSEEYLSGNDLWDLIMAGGEKPKENELKVLLLSLLKAISELWNLGYVHRDIKPGNIIKTSTPARPFVLLDLGIAYSINEASLTYRPGSRVMATYRYLAPELIRPDFRENIDFRSDLYTTALTIYEYSAQRHPIAHNYEDDVQTISRALRDIPISLKNYRPDLSDGFCELINQMLKKSPHLRPANINSLIKRYEGELQ